MSLLDLFKQNNNKRKPNERGEWLVLTARKLNKPIGQVGALVRNWETKGIKDIYLAAESLEKETKEPFSKFWFWQLKEIRKTFLVNETKKDKRK